MYEHHIARLQAKLTGSGDEELHVAIALMRAAEPKDESGEWVRLNKLCHELTGLGSNPHQMGLLQQSHAAARAEGYAAGRSEHHDDWQPELDRLQAELTEARAALETATENEGKLNARIAKLETVITARTVVNDDYMAKLAAANARIAELDQKLTSSQAWSQEFKTKLAALLQAAERAYKVLALDLPARPENREIVEYVRAAIEASKK